MLEVKVVPEAALELRKFGFVVGKLADACASVSSLPAVQIAGRTGFGGQHAVRPPRLPRGLKAPAVSFDYNGRRYVFAINGLSSTKQLGTVRSSRRA